MSFEGYYQILCANGHLDTVDVFGVLGEGLLHWECPVCNSRIKWYNIVDETNGTFDEDENGNKIRIDGYVELGLMDMSGGHMCLTCGHEITYDVYRIPEDVGQIVDIVKEDMERKL